jgi:hypothetical protein
MEMLASMGCFIAANVQGLPQFGYLMLCPPGDDAY